MKNIVETETELMPPFFSKLPLVIERGQGVYVYDTQGKKYLDFTSGWGVTCLGHASPVITEALTEQSQKIIQNPESGLTYSPVRAELLQTLKSILPEGLSKIFFTNSGAEANDAAIKLARKATGKAKIISTFRSFHGRTISTMSATGQTAYLSRFNPLMPGYVFVPYGDRSEIRRQLDNETAAVILEPIQGEGGVIVPPEPYLAEVKAMCKSAGALLIFDEIQTGFFRTGPAFISSELGLAPDILTMAKGIAGGFPFGGFAMTKDVANNLRQGDHGGTYCGNPLGCAVSLAVIRALLNQNIEQKVRESETITKQFLIRLQRKTGTTVKDIRGRGLLMAMELESPEVAKALVTGCRENGLILNLTQGTVIRIFPALNISAEALREGFDTIEKCLISLL